MTSTPAPRVLFTDMRWTLMLVLVAIGLPRTVLADLDIVAPESSLLYYVLALVPFAVWLVVAVVRPTRKPVLDFLVVGVLYGLSLILVHQLLWNAPGAGHSVPQSAIDFAEQVSPDARELVLRAYTAGISLVIGLGTGLACALVAAIAGRVRSSRHRHPNRTGGGE